MNETVTDGARLLLFRIGQLIEVLFFDVDVTCRTRERRLTGTCKTTASESMTASAVQAYLRCQQRSDARDREDYHRSCRVWARDCRLY